MTATEELTSDADRLPIREPDHAAQVEVLDAFNKLTVDFLGGAR